MHATASKFLLQYLVRLSIEEFGQSYLKKYLSTIFSPALMTWEVCAESRSRVTNEKKRACAGGLKNPVFLDCPAP